MTQTLRSDVGQLLVVGGIIGGLGGRRAQAAQMRAMARGEIGGVYLGYPHFLDPADAARTIRRLQERARLPLFMAADFEAGPGYNCAAGCAHFPYLMGLGFINDPATTRKVAEVTARQSQAMGINWLFSPCLDVNLQPDNPIIGIRSFGEDTKRVTGMGTAFIEGCLRTGILSTAKHFPGTGNTRADTHIVSAMDVGDLAIWEKYSLPPFAAAIRAAVPCIMTGHAAMPFLDPSGVPASFSRIILHDILRTRLGFQGILISDSLGMGGAGVGRTVGDRCVNAFKAGCDVLLTPYSESIFTAFERTLRRDRKLRAQFDVSLERVAKARRAVSPLKPGRIHPEDEEFACDVGRRSVRILRGAELLPLRHGGWACLTQWRDRESEYFPREPGVLSRLQHEIRTFDPGAPVIPLSRECPAAEQAAVRAAIGTRRTVILGAIVKNYAGDPWRGRLSPGTLALIRRLASAGKTVVLAILGSPYAASASPAARVIICSGGDTLGNVAGIIEKLFGESRQRAGC